MKTTKLILVAALMAFATYGFSQSKLSAESNQTQNEPQLALNISFNSAMNNPDLVKAMYAQLDPSFLQNEQRMYTVRVNYRHTSVYVTGSYAQWMRFFQVIPVPFVTPEK